MNTTTIPLRSAAMVLSRLWVLEMALCRLVCLEKKLLNLRRFSFSVHPIFASKGIGMPHSFISPFQTFSKIFQETDCRSIYSTITSGFLGIWCSWVSIIKLPAEDSASDSFPTKCKYFNVKTRHRLWILTLTNGYKILPRCNRRSSADSFLDRLHQFCNGAEIENPL